MKGRPCPVLASTTRPRTRLSLVDGLWATSYGAASRLRHERRFGARCARDCDACQDRRCKTRGSHPHGSLVLVAHHEDEAQPTVAWEIGGTVLGDEAGTVLAAEAVSAQLDPSVELDLHSTDRFRTGGASPRASLLPTSSPSENTRAGQRGHRRSWLGHAPRRRSSCRRRRRSAPRRSRARARAGPRRGLRRGGRCETHRASRERPGHSRRDQ